jgi:hypothetical protein
MRWTLPQAAPLDPGAVYDGLALEEVLLRFPARTPSGGHLALARTTGTARIGDLVIPLEPGEPEELRALLLAFVDALVKRRGLVDPAATATLTAAPVPTPPESERPLGTL